MADKTAADVLREAAEYIGEHGWVQGAMEWEGHVCAIGAISRVSGSQGKGFGAEFACDDFGALEALRKHLGLRIRDADFALHPIANWNDEPERTAEDVILAMKRTAEELDSESR